MSPLLWLLLWAAGAACQGDDTRARVGVDADGNLVINTTVPTRKILLNGIDIMQEISEVKASVQGMATALSDQGVYGARRDIVAFVDNQGFYFDGTRWIYGTFGEPLSAVRVACSPGSDEDQNRGYFTTEGLQNKLYSWRTPSANWTRENVDLPRASSACLVRGGLVYFFGGYPPGGVDSYGDLFIWNLSAKVLSKKKTLQFTTSGPKLIFFHGMMYAFFVNYTIGGMATRNVIAKYDTVLDAWDSSIPQLAAGSLNFLCPTAVDNLLLIQLANGTWFSLTNATGATWKREATTERVDNCIPSRNGVWGRRRHPYVYWVTEVVEYALPSGTMSVIANLPLDQAAYTTIYIMRVPVGV